MSSNGSKLIHYKRSRFTTHLPDDFRYTPSHAWLQQIGDKTWRVGITKFATRMLGEMVDHGFEMQADARIECGQVLGWIEGFKAISDIYGTVEGNFLRSNEVLKKKVMLVSKQPYTEGWLYEASGSPDTRCIGVNEYMAFLDVAIDKILAKEMSAE